MRLDIGARVKDVLSGPETSTLTVVAFDPPALDGREIAISGLPYGFTAALALNGGVRVLVEVV